MQNIIQIFGPPGGGKGTQAKNIVKASGFIHLSTGHLFRQKADLGDALGLKLRPLLKEGKFVDDTTTNKVVADFLKQHPDKNVVFDGYPRNIEQVPHFELLTKQSSKTFIYLTVDEEELIARLLRRGDVEGRSDDQVEVIKRRIETYKKATAPVVKYFAEYYQNSFYHFDGTGKQPEDVWSEIKKII